MAGSRRSQTRRRQQSLRAPPSPCRRGGFVPRRLEDFSDGGAFPEIHVAQYPLGMGRRDEKGGSKILALTVDAKGSVAFDAVVKQGENAAGAPARPPPPSPPVAPLTCAPPPLTRLSCRRYSGPHLRAAAACSHRRPKLGRRSLPPPAKGKRGRERERRHWPKGRRGEREKGEREEEEGGLTLSGDRPSPAGIQPAGAARAARPRGHGVQYYSRPRPARKLVGRMRCSRSSGGATAHRRATPGTRGSEHECHASPPPPPAIAPPPSSSCYRAFLISDGAGRPKRRQIWLRIKPPPPLLLRPPRPSSSSGQRGVELANVDLVVGNLDLLSGGEDAEAVVGRWKRTPLPSLSPTDLPVAMVGGGLSGSGVDFLSTPDKNLTRNGDPF
uniref:Uncharacterized protein n=1 Tax=Oryza sativa subsp. japonica TaxID=39947 RepID=Q6K5J1_ORYSJ|nr:hypothetical protein [Oryza sativa Japonica Group]BAD22118.1 hypothetical protein [Oryza sativa Japonica Group]